MPGTCVAHGKSLQNMFLPTWEQASFRPSGSSEKLSTVQSKRSSHVTSHSKTPATSTAQYNRHLEGSLPSRCKFVSRRTADWKRSSSRLSKDVSASMWLCNQQAYSSLLRTYGDTLLNVALGAACGRFWRTGEVANVCPHEGAPHSPSWQCTGCAGLLLHKG